MSAATTAARPIEVGALQLNACRLNKAPETLQTAFRSHHLAKSVLLRKYVRLSIDLLDEACYVANQAYELGNSGEAHELLVEISEGQDMVVRSNTLPTWFTATKLWQSFSGDLPAQPQLQPYRLNGLRTPPASSERR